MPVSARAGGPSSRSAPSSPQPPSVHPASSFRAQARRRARRWHAWGAVGGLVLAALLGGCAGVSPGTPSGRPVDGAAAGWPRGGGAEPELERVGPRVRLALARGVGTVELRGRALLVRDAAGSIGLLAGRPGQGRLVLASGEAGRLLLEGRPASTAAVAVDAAGPLAVAVDGGPVRRYRGRLEVTAQAGGLLLVNELPLERYLVGVVGLEMDPAWPAEALRAQAVAARTYSLYQRHVRRLAAGPSPAPGYYDLEAGILDQVYDGADGEEWLADAGGAPVLAVFHSTAGGYTEAAGEVWGRPLPYLVGRPCPFDRDSPVYAWRWTVPVDEVARRLAAAGYRVAAGLPGLEIAERTATGRVRSLTVEAAGGGRVLIPAPELRRLLGYSRLRSTRFAVARDGGTLSFEGRGAGHGVGLCQWGARGMALAGYDYRAILGFYYPGTRLVVGSVPGDEPR